jgi:hypothetical protein
MIKKYLEFIKESQILYKGFNSLGEWIESISDDIYIKNIVTRYTTNVPVDIDMANAINTLDVTTQSEIKQQVEDYLLKGIEEKEPMVTPSTEVSNLMESLEQEITIAGKGIFTSFLKTLTAMGLKENNPNWDMCPNDFLLYYIFTDLETDLVKQVFSRFKSLQRYLPIIDYQKNNLNLYFGLTSAGECEYGISYDSRFPIGKFKLSKSVVKWILSLESKSASSLKKEIVNLGFSDMITLGGIKNDMMNYNPGYFEKKSLPILRDRVISFGYYGIGKWDNGKLDEGELLNIKNNFTTWLISKKWGGKVLISVKPESFWLNIHIKLK